VPKHKPREKHLLPTTQYINRELSWLEFNDRVLREGLSRDVPLMERLKFLAIVSSNLDEFFMIRVAGLCQQRAARSRKRDHSGLTPAQQLHAISERVRRMVAEQTAGIKATLQELRLQGLAVLSTAEWTSEQRQYLRSHYLRQIQPVLTPLAMDGNGPHPVLPGQQICIAAQCSTPAGMRIVVVPVPSNLPRFITLPCENEVQLARLEDLIATHMGNLVNGCVEATALFRITRDADVHIEDDDAADLLEHVERAVLDRRRRQAVRLAISAPPDKLILQWLCQELQVGSEHVYTVEGLLDAAALMEIVDRHGFEALRYPEWPAQPSRDLPDEDDLWQTLTKRDALLFHPYESFRPVVRLLREAAADPHVLAIKQTLYRTSGHSPVIEALEQAANNGKQVTVLVELKARFDEARNVQWARRLEDAGCLVIYGIAGYKTHAKALLIVRREQDRVRRYVHLGTGNYNEKTAALYSDLGLMTAENDIASDVAMLFNVLTGTSEVMGWSRLSIAPTDLRRRLCELIEREIQTATTDQPGLIQIKMNSLEDPEICQALYQASRTGVTVRLNVRGICCLRPDTKGRIEVRSIIDRYLEHARILHFRNGGNEEVYLSSADCMRRNLDKRLEILFPVKNARLRQRLVGILDTLRADNVKSWRLRPDGAYEPVTGSAPLVRAQECFYCEALDATSLTRQETRQFKPLIGSQPRAHS
jgi:polyphosphate kinase